MSFLTNLFLTGCGLSLILFVIAFTPETFRYFRDKYRASHPMRAQVKASYKRAGLPPLSALLLFVAVVSLYLIGTAIL